MINGCNVVNDDRNLVLGWTLLLVKDEISICSPTLTASSLTHSP